MDREHVEEPRTRKARLRTPLGKITGDKELQT